MGAMCRPVARRVAPGTEKEACVNRKQLSSASIACLLNCTGGRQACERRHGGGARDGRTECVGRQTAGRRRSWRHTWRGDPRAGRLPRSRRAPTGPAGPSFAASHPGHRERPPRCQRWPSTPGTAPAMPRPRTIPPARVRERRPGLRRCATAGAAQARIGGRLCFTSSHQYGLEVRVGARAHHCAQQLRSCGTWSRSRTARASNVPAP